MENNVHEEEHKLTMRRKVTSVHRQRPETELALCLFKFLTSEPTVSPPISRMLSLGVSQTIAVKDQVVFLRCVSFLFYSLRKDTWSHST